MRARKIKNKTSKSDDYIPEPEEEKTMKDECRTKQKNSKYHANDSRHQKTKSHSRELDNSSNQEDSQQSEILEIRHGDEMAREHVRPSFLRRWDGVSNELELTQD